MREKRWAGAITDIIGNDETAQYHFRVQGRSMAPTLQPGDEVIVERCTLEALQPGDLVLLQNGDQPLLHRFLGVRRRDGQVWLLTGGDQKRHLDPLWPEGALLGRAITVRRGEHPLPLQTRRWNAWRLRMRAVLRAVAYCLRLAPVLMLPLILLAAETSWASVTLVSFDAEWVGDTVRITWETASETNNIGFYVLRSEQEGGGYQRVTEVIPSEGDIMGSVYDWIDSDAVPGTAYYYKLEDLSASGGSTFTGSVSPPTEAATATFTPTPEPTATDTPLPSLTPTPTPLPSSTPTSPPTHTPPPSPTPSATATMPPTPTFRPTATSTAPATSSPPPTPQPSATASHTPLPPSATNTQIPSPQPYPSLTATPKPPATPLPSPTVTALAVVVAAPAEGDSGSHEQLDSTSPAESIDQEALAHAKRRLTWSLIGIAGAIGGALLLIALALLIFALYQWGFLRPG